MLTWESMDHEDEPRDQLTDNLPGRLYAVLGPDDYRRPDEWSWDIRTLAEEHHPTVAFGYAADENAAKRAVTEWVIGCRLAEAMAGRS